MTAVAAVAVVIIATGITVVVAAAATNASSAPHYEKLGNGRCRGVRFFFCWFPLGMVALAFLIHAPWRLRYDRAIRVALIVEGFL